VAASSRLARGSGGPAGPAGPATDSRARIGLLIVVLVLATAVVIAADLIIGIITNPNGSSGQAGAPSATPGVGVVVQGNGGSWTNVNPDQLALMLAHKDFTLVDVKTPYMGEIEGTDQYIPYDQLTARASELPSDKRAEVLVYCRSGVQSAQAAQTLLDLGYTNVWNLDGGMVAWQASGRTVVDKGRK
jgi:rhodanese-related sulfurtransferase